MISLTLLLSWAKRIPWQVYALSGVLLSFWLYGKWQYEQGQEDVQKDWNASIERGKKLVQDLETKAKQINTVVETKYVDRVKVVHEKAKIITKEIPVYIPVNTPDLPGGFRLLHDAAASSTIPDRSLISTAAPVSVTTATETIVTNYALCHQWRLQVLGWQEWYQEQSHAWRTDPHR